jgi:hypothetical protein
MLTFACVLMMMIVAPQTQPEERTRVKRQRNTHIDPSVCGWRYVLAECLGSPPALGAAEALNNGKHGETQSKW